jgi:Flp pilus assembly protein TadG
VFLIVVAGIMEFGRALMVMNLVTNAAREGARMAVIDGCTNSEVTTSINSFLTQSLGQPGSAATTTITVAPATGNPDPLNQVGNATTRDLITVKVQIPYNSVALISGKYLAGKNLTGISSMRHE